METKNIMIVGVGGQGTLLTSRILGGIAMQAGYDVKLSEVHGMAQRGGSVVTFVRYGEKVAEPIGVVAAVIPTTNPTSTAIFKCLLALKTRNAIIISPHPRAKNCTIAAAKLVLEAAVAAGAPENIISWIDQPSIELSSQVMREADLTLATGGPGMVRSASAEKST